MPVESLNMVVHTMMFHRKGNIDKFFQLGRVAFRVFQGNSRATAILSALFPFALFSQVSKFPMKENYRDFCKVALDTIVLQRLSKLLQKWIDQLVPNRKYTHELPSKDGDGAPAWWPRTIIYCPVAYLNRKGNSPLVALS
jgi:hypothetical protein